MAPVVPCVPFVPCVELSAPVVPCAPLSPFCPLSPVTWNEQIISSLLPNGVAPELASVDTVNIYHWLVSCPATPVIWYNIKSLVLDFSDTLTCPFIVEDESSIVYINETILLLLSSVASI